MRARPDCGVCGALRAPGTACRPCSNRRNAAYKARHAAAVRAARAAYKKQKWVAGAATRAAKRAARRASLAARRKAAKLKWKAANRGAVNAHTAARSAAKLRAVPVWADKARIKRIYAEARARGLHVDHVIPLRSPVVCGLHVEDNLQLLPPLENIRKGNRLHVGA